MLVTSPPNVDSHLSLLSSHPYWKRSFLWGFSVAERALGAENRMLGGGFQTSLCLDDVHIGLLSHQSFLATRRCILRSPANQRISSDEHPTTVNTVPKNPPLRFRLINRVASWDTREKQHCIHTLASGCIVQPCPKGAKFSTGLESWNTGCPGAGHAME